MGRTLEDKWQEAWNEAYNACCHDMKKAYLLIAEAKEIAAAASEKHGIPISLCWEVYPPISIKKWLDETTKSADEIIYYKKLIHSQYSYRFGDYISLDEWPTLGKFWEPSYNCY